MTSSAVLIVEDCKIVARITARLLQGMGFEVHLAANGKQALVKYLERAYSFILMDYEMPEMNGGEATLAIRRAERPTKTRIPIIGYSSVDRSICLAADMDDYLGKPASLAELSAKIVSWSGVAEVSCPCRAELAASSTPY